MKIIDLKDRTIFIDDIVQIYKEDNYCPTRYHIQTNNGTYRVTKEDYHKIRDYLLSLNDEIEILEAEKKIPEKLDKYADISGDLAYNWTFGEKKLKDKIDEIIDYLDYLKSKGDE